MQTGQPSTSVDTSLYATIHDSNTGLQLTVTSVDMSPKHWVTANIKNFENIINCRLNLMCG